MSGLGATHTAGRDSALSKTGATALIGCNRTEDPAARSAQGRLDLGLARTREHHNDLFVGAIFEGPYNWTVRPVAEVFYEREFDVTETFSILAGAIWKVSDDLSFDVGLREAWVNRQPVTEIRAGLTFAISMQKEAMQRSSRALRR